jgi:hypothetical protein
MMTAPVRVPAAVGLKVTLIVHDALGLIVLLQLLVWAKSPVVAIPVMLNGPLPVFFTVAGSAGLTVPTSWEPKIKVAGVRLTAGMPPVPVSGSWWGLPGALSVIVTAPVRIPVAVGVKVTLSVQKPAGAILAGQLSV